jgi:hypothetical protein
VDNEKLRFFSCLSDILWESEESGEQTGDSGGLLGESIAPSVDKLRENLFGGVRRPHAAVPLTSHAIFRLQVPE